MPITDARRPRFAEQIESAKTVSMPHLLARGLETLMTIGLALFLLFLPFHLVIKKFLPDPLGTYWKEMLLGLLVLLWAIDCLLSRRLLSSGTPLDWAVVFYAGLLLLRFVVDRSGQVGAWGLYVSAMYLPLFWVTPVALRRSSRTLPRLPGSWVAWLIALLIGVGGVVALGGLIEFVRDVPLWPSSEMVLRQGFPDVFIYGTHLRRVYFVFDSPTTLANTLAMLLPLALALMLLSRRVWARLAAGLAAVLMAACIVVTFSRGIWVATVFSLVAMGLLSGAWRRFAEQIAPRLGLRQSRAVFGAVGVLALVALVGGGVMAWQAGQSAPAYRGVVELAPEAYRAAPVTGVSAELLQLAPAHGVAVTQTWTLLDPITDHDDTRVVLYEHPPESGKEEIIYRVTVPPAGALRFAIALSPEVWSPEKGDGATFQVYVSEPDTSEPGQFVLTRYINPKQNPSDRRWRNLMVDLSPWTGRTVNLSLITEAGPAHNWAFDWAGWAELQIVSMKPGYFATAQIDAKGVALHHAGSILDWATDETNRDRLAAWSLALNAWRTAPLWGNGLGSTGVAALRINPERAFVTESQVLKALVELGLPGLLALAYLWFQISRVGYRAYRASRLDFARKVGNVAGDPSRRVLLLGILTSLLIVFVEGWVYQNLEAKQVNAYFWTLVGALAFLARN